MLQMNQPGPHVKDIGRFERAVEKINATLADGSLDIISKYRAQTGSMYITVEYQGNDDSMEEQREYRFAAHAECYTSHDFSVRSGGGSRASDILEPGYDGNTTAALADVRKWVSWIVESEIPTIFEI